MSIFSGIVVKWGTFLVLRVVCFGSGREMEYVSGYGCEIGCVLGYAGSYVSCIVAKLECVGCSVSGKVGRVFRV